MTSDFANLVGSFSPASHGALCHSPYSPTTPFQQMVSANLVAPLPSLPNLVTSHSPENEFWVTPHLQMAKPLPMALQAKAALRQKQPSLFPTLPFPAP